jgi:hypothetical protein
MGESALDKRGMGKKRIQCIIAGLKRFHLTESETQLIRFVEQNLNQNVPLDGKIELILEWIYSRKTAFIRNSVFSFLSQKQERRGSSTWPATA